LAGFFIRSIYLPSKGFCERKAWLPPEWKAPATCRPATDETGLTTPNALTVIDALGRPNRLSTGASYNINPSIEKSSVLVELNCIDGPIFYVVPQR
jgi:hypothetical protein